MNIPQLLKLSGEDMRKIFPQNYYTKYATHLKLLEFQKIAIEEEKKRSKLNFQMRKAREPQIPDRPTKIVKINKYDDYQETIQKNKEELKRLNKYKTVLDLKLRTSPSPKKNIIRSPTKMDRELDQKVLLRLKAVDDMEYEEEKKIMQKAKDKKERQAVCKFVYNSKSIGGSPRKKHTNPEDDQILDQLTKIATNTIDKNNSLMFSQRNLDKNSSYISNVNTAIRKSHSTLKMSSKMSGSKQAKIARALSNRQLGNSSKIYSRGKKREQKRDLVGETVAIRNEVHSMKLIKRYDELMKTRAHNQHLAKPL